MRVFSVLGDLH